MDAAMVGGAGVSHWLVIYRGVDNVGLRVIM